MAKAKKERTPEQIEADRARMQKVREARQNKNSKTKVEMTDNSTVLPPIFKAADILAAAENEGVAPEPSDTVQETINAEPNLTDLQRQIQELKDMQWALMKGALAGTVGGNEQVNAENGKLTGTFEKYALSPDLYPDPSERLAEEVKLQRFAFKMNYELDYHVGDVSYTTIDNIRTKEPKFELTLVRVMLDEDTGEDTGGRYDICRLIMHEDPDTALTIARQVGFDMESLDEAMFLNEMRYIRMRDWLLEAFYPPKPDPKKEKRDMVINGKLVQYWQKNAEEGTGEGGLKKIDWDNVAKVKF